VEARLRRGQAGRRSWRRELRKQPCNATPGGFPRVSANLPFIQGSSVGTAARPPPAPPSTPPSSSASAAERLLDARADAKGVPVRLRRGPRWREGTSAAPRRHRPTPDNRASGPRRRVRCSSSAHPLGSVAAGVLGPVELRPASRVPQARATSSSPRGPCGPVRRRSSAGDDSGPQRASARRHRHAERQGLLHGASDGGIFTFGGAVFRGSMEARGQSAGARPVPTATGAGYWPSRPTAASSPSATPFLGSMGGAVEQPVVGMVRYGNGYLMVGSDGGIFTSAALRSSGRSAPARRADLERRSGLVVGREPTLPR
jgi:hypothetical protein